MNLAAEIMAQVIATPPPVDSISRARVDYVHGRIDHDEYERRIEACMTQEPKPKP